VLSALKDGAAGTAPEHTAAATNRKRDGAAGIESGARPPRGAAEGEMRRTLAGGATRCGAAGGTRETQGRGAAAATLGRGAAAAPAREDNGTAGAEGMTQPPHGTAAGGTHETPERGMAAATKRDCDGAAETTGGELAPSGEETSAARRAIGEAREERGCETAAVPDKTGAAPEPVCDGAAGAKSSARPLHRAAAGGTGS